MKLDVIEAIANALIGYLISVLAAYLLFPIFGWQASVGQSFAISALFFFISLARSFILRRIFRMVGER